MLNLEEPEDVMLASKKAIACLCRSLTPLDSFCLLLNICPGALCRLTLRGVKWVVLPHEVPQIMSCIMSAFPVWTALCIVISDSALQIRKS